MSETLIPTGESVPALSAIDQSPKRRQVLDAATELFLAHGYGAVSMDAVARSAGVSKATLYAHFPSKDVLFASIVRERGLTNQLDGSLFPEHVTDLRAALEAIGRRVMRFMLQERTLAIYRVALAEAVRFPELGRAFFENGPAKFCDWGQHWLSAQQAAGLVRQADVGIATQQFMALLRSDVFLRASLALAPAPGEAEVEATVRAAVDTWLRAFGTEPPAEPGFCAPQERA
jgi:TetR/AcrR family transcriptional regulator, mexJK operon transcriptional repressor